MNECEDSLRIKQLLFYVKQQNNDKSRHKLRAEEVYFLPSVFHSCRNDLHVRIVNTEFIFRKILGSSLDMQNKYMDVLQKLHRLFRGIHIFWYCLVVKLS